MQPTQELWLPAPEGGGWYDVSNLGRVRSWHAPGGSGRRRVEPLILKPKKHPHGYRMVCMRVGGVPLDRTIHSLVMRAFVGPRPDAHDVAHWNGDKTDNRLENLRWATRAENMGDTLRQGNLPRGERHGQSVLTVESVRFIRSSTLTVRELSALLGASQGAIGAVRDGRSWRWLDAPDKSGPNPYRLRYRYKKRTSRAATPQLANESR